MEGPFRDPRRASVPILAALGGMAVPALIYLAIAAPADAAFAKGWAIPAATDIAFALGVFCLLGGRAPAGLRLFLLAIAIVDDLGAIVVIAIFYTDQIIGWAMGGALLTWVVMLALNRWGVRRLWPFCLLGVGLWAFMLQSGIHATIAGVLTAAAIPISGPEGRSPLAAAEHFLKPWVQLAIMPLFALANASVSLAGVGAADYLHPVALGAGLGLSLGKPLGIFTVTAMACALLRRPLPAAPLALLGVSMIAGIGFTMSLFIGALAFKDPMLATPVRLGVLGGSLASALLGYALLAACVRRPPTDVELAIDEAQAERAGVLEDDNPDARTPYGAPRGRRPRGS